MIVDPMPTRMLQAQKNGGQYPPPERALHDSGHDSRGRFAKGNRGGPGNPYARQVAALRQAFLDAVTRQDMHEIAIEFLIRARKGEVGPARLLLSYVLGKPAAMPDPDRLDVEEWNLYDEASPTAEVGTRIMKTADLAAALPTVRATRDIYGAQVEAKFAEDMAARVAALEAAEGAKQQAQQTHQEQPEQEEQGGPARAKSVRQSKRTLRKAA